MVLGSSDRTSASFLLVRVDRFKAGLVRIYVLGSGLYGAKLAGVVYNEETARIRLAATGGRIGILDAVLHLILGETIIKIFLKRVRKTIARNEERYRNMNLQSSQFLAISRTNFHLPVEQITQVQIRTKFTFWTKQRDTDAILTFELANGRKMKFGLPKEERLSRILSMLSAQGIATHSDQDQSDSYLRTASFI